MNPVFEITLNRRAKVGAIDFDGLSQAEVQQERAALSSFWTHFEKGRLKDGTTFTAERIQAAVSRIRNTLAASNRLAQEVSLASTNYSPTANRADLLFHVKLGPSLTVQIEGAHISKRTLKKLIPIYQESSYDSDLLAESRMDLASYFQSKGYFDVQVASKVQQTPDKIAVIFDIQKGSKHRVSKVAFTGNQAIGNAALRAAVVVKPKQWLFSRGKYSETLLRASAGKIENMYRVLGFPDVKVTTRVQDLEPNVNITFEITEGQRATVHNFQIVGGIGLDTSKLPAHALRLGMGKPYSPELELEDRNDILAYYLDLGFLNAQLKSTATPFNGDKDRVDVAYQIQRGPQTRIQDVLYLGNVRTKTNLIAHTAALTPEMPLSESKMLAAESNLYNLGIFDWTSVGPRRAEEITSQLVETSIRRAPRRHPMAVLRALRPATVPKEQARARCPRNSRRTAKINLRRKARRLTASRARKFSSKYTNHRETRSITVAGSNLSAVAGRRPAARSWFPDSRRSRWEAISLPANKDSGARLVLFLTRCEISAAAEKPLRLPFWALAWITAPH